MQGLSLSEINNIKNSSFTTDNNHLINKIKLAKKMDMKEVYKLIYKGSMPNLFVQEINIQKFYSSYVNTYLHRDIRDLAQVGDEIQFHNFLIACAARTSQMLNYSEIAKDVGISVPTAKKWLSILVSTNIIILVQPYFNNALKRIVKSPNMYFMDTGLCAYLTRWNSAETLEISAMSGAFFKTFVVSEIVKTFLNEGIEPPIFYYRDSDKKEIDLIIDNNNVLEPIEIKKTSQPNKSSVKHFNILKKTKKQIGNGAVICMSDDLFPIDENSWAIPVWMI